MKNPKISVCIPVYNSEIWFAQCIESIERQTFKDWEIIVVDDCSTDGIERLYCYFEAKHGDRFRVFKNSKNMGIGATRNHAVANAHGDIVCVQDADDMSHHERLRKTWDYFKRHKKIDLVYGGYIIVDSIDKPLREIPGKPFDPIEIKRHNYIAHPTVAYRRDSFLDVLYRPDCDVLDDWFLYLDFMNKGKKIGHMEDVIAYHRELMSGVSLSKEKRDRVAKMREKFAKEVSADIPVMVG